MLAFQSLLDHYYDLNADATGFHISSQLRNNGFHFTLNTWETERATNCLINFEEGGRKPEHLDKNHTCPSVARCGFPVSVPQDP